MGAFCEPMAGHEEWEDAAEHTRSWEESHHEMIISLLREFQHVSAAEHVSSIEERFREHAEKWERDTMHVSSTTKMVLHPSYQAIIGMGRDVVPLLLRDLQENRRSWFWALTHITEANPVNPRDAGNVDNMIHAWLNWGRERGML